MISCLARDVDAARRLVEDQQPRLGGQPARQQHLLLVAARQLRDRRVDVGGLDAERLDVVLGDLLPGARATGSRAACRPGLQRQDDVLAHRQLGDDAFVLAVFRAERRCRAAIASRGRVEAHAACRRRASSPLSACVERRTAAAPARCGRSRAGRRGRDLALVQRQIDRLQRAARGPRPRGLQQRRLPSPALAPCAASAAADARVSRPTISADQRQPAAARPPGTRRRARRCAAR